MSFDSVALKRCDSYDQAVVDSAVEAVFSGCAPALDPKGGKAKVLLKVNLLMKAQPHDAVTTHPAVVRGVVRSLKRRGFTNIVIADSPSGQFSLARLKGIYEAAGMADVAKQEGVSLNTDLSASLVRSRGGRDFEILNAVLGADYVIGIAKLKTHAMVGFTCGVKNYFGVVPGLSKSSKHLENPDLSGFCNMLCDLYDILAPAFTVVDAVVGMEGDGPSAGTPRDIGIIAGGTDAHVLDRALSHLVGFGPETALLTGAAIKLGRAPENISDIVFVGDSDVLSSPINDFKKASTARVAVPSFLPAFLQPVFEQIVKSMSPRPVIRTADCIGCGRCKEICPNNTIEIKDKKALIITSGCIRCFCCHEVCPEKAIDIKKFLRNAR